MNNDIRVKRIFIVSPKREDVFLQNEVVVKPIKRKFRKKKEVKMKNTINKKTQLDISDITKRDVSIKDLFFKRIKTIKNIDISFCDLAISLLLVGSFVQMFDAFGFTIAGFFKAFGFEFCIVILIRAGSTAKKNNISTFILTIFLVLAILAVANANLRYEWKLFLGLEKITSNDLKILDWYTILNSIVSSGILPIMLLATSIARQVYVKSEAIKNLKQKKGK